MTVAELIERLKDMPAEALVAFASPDTNSVYLAGGLRPSVRYLGHEIKNAVIVITDGMEVRE
jgi:hypothetical protein